MMHTATEGLKFKRLVRRIRQLASCEQVSAETIAVGLLERLWHAAAREARDGKIGAKFDNDDIAELIGWTGDSDLLLDALVKERWLDLVEGVLVVHDWDDHKPNWLRGVNSRRGAVRELGAVLDTQPSCEPSRELGTQLSNQHRCEPSKLLPNQTEPNQTLPNQTRPNETEPNKINTAAASQPAAARFDFSLLEDTPDHRELARLAAERLHKAAGKVLTREFIWTVAWISEGAVRGFCTEMHDKLRSGGVNNYRRYIERALDGELSKLGVTIAQCSEFVPAIGQRIGQTV